MSQNRRFSSWAWVETRSLFALASASAAAVFSAVSFSLEAVSEAFSSFCFASSGASDDAGAENFAICAFRSAICLSEAAFESVSVLFSASSDFLCDWTEFAHTILSNHSSSDSGCVFHIVRSTGSNFAKHQFFSGSTT